MFDIRRAAMRCLTALATATLAVLSCGCEEGQHIELPLSVLQQLEPRVTSTSPEPLLAANETASLTDAASATSAAQTEMPAALPGETPAASASPTPSISPMPTATLTPSPTPAATPTTTPAATPTAAPTPTPTPTPTPDSTQAPDNESEKAIKTENENHDAALQRLSDSYQQRRAELEASRNLLMMDGEAETDAEIKAELEQNTIALDLARVEYETAVAQENARHESELARLKAQ